MTTVYGYINQNIDRVKREVNMGLMPVSILRHWEIYSRYDLHRRMGSCVSEAVEHTAIDMGCCDSTVFKVVNKFEKQI